MRYLFQTVLILHSSNYSLECDLIWNIYCCLVYFSQVHVQNSNGAADKQGDHSGAQNGTKFICEQARNKPMN